MAVKMKHGTLSASTVATVTLTGDFDQVEVVNTDGAAAIYFSVDGSTPTVEGDETYVVPAAKERVTVPNVDLDDTVVKLISSGTPKYAVTGK